jgi:pyruvate kinase
MPPRSPETSRAGGGRGAPPPAASIPTELDVVAITCYTETGRTARLLSAERPSVPVYAFIPPVEAQRSTCLLWGIEALPASIPTDTDEMIALMDAGLQAHGLASPGDSVVMAAASPAGRTTTNMLKIHRVGMPVR